MLTAGVGDADSQCGVCDVDSQCGGCDADSQCGGPAMVRIACKHNG